VGVTGLLSDIYHCFVEVRNWVSIFLIFHWILSFAGALSLPRDCAELFSQGVGRGVMHGAWCSLVLLLFYSSSFGVGWQGDLAHFFFSAVQHREALHGLVVLDVTEFDSDWCSVFCLLGEEKK
jgi:hypothetical protein